MITDSPIFCFRGPLVINSTSSLKDMRILLREDSSPLWPDLRRSDYLAVICCRLEVRARWELIVVKLSSPGAKPARDGVYFSGEVEARWREKDGPCRASLTGMVEHLLKISGRELWLITSY